MFETRARPRQPQAAGAPTDRMSDATVPEREGAATRVVLTYDAGEMPEAARFWVHDESTDIVIERTD